MTPCQNTKVDFYTMKYYFKSYSALSPNYGSKSVSLEISIPIRIEGNTCVVFAEDYLNKLSGERIERECKRQLEAGCQTLVVNFAKTELVNSIGISILLGVIDAASGAGADVVFSDVNEDTTELFEMLGLTNHVTVKKTKE